MTSTKNILKYQRPSYEIVEPVMKAPSLNSSPYAFMCVDVDERSLRETA